MIKILNNFISKQHQLYFKNVINYNEFPWYLIKGEDQVLTHTLYNYPKGLNSSYYIEFKIIIDALEQKEGIRIIQLLKIRCRKILSIKNKPIPQVSLPDVKNYKTFIYNVDNCEGDTSFFKERHSMELPDKHNLTELNPTENINGDRGTGIYFDGDIYHTNNFETAIIFDFKIDDNYNN